ncbi:hypothetical protein HK100_002621 [Physocladia obscura]|uniref:Peptidase M3A/M3B catalytic domain-containing protein n=1 Tax=Physocladia obscura TaxID=109957 RepID=A0AAD5SWU5_9FUNG|nr:hypothetical protein HK100_002621 [Physocladia obscura]
MSTTVDSVTQFIESFNASYEQKHKAFEDNFWATKMNLKGSSSDELTRTKNELDTFLGDASMLARVQELLKRSDLSNDNRKTLLIFERTFKCYIITDPVGIAMREELNRLEAKLAENRRAMKLGYTDPVSGNFVEASTVQIRSIMRTSSNEAVRKSCYEAMRSIGPFIAPEFVEICKLRNKLARSLGYECYYDMKVTAAEGFGKHTLFPILEKLAERSKGIRNKALATLAKEKGETALEPWNIGYYLSGDLSALQDPYFPFETAVNAWARSFAALGIKYSGATMQLDLCDRTGKYSNGFCHWPQPAWVSPTRGWIPSQANFTSLATPGQIGSGHTALVTLMHEGGHAAHFANVAQPSPLFSQERAPTSIPYAENQSMFLDSLVGDAAWLGRYATTKAGKVMPWDLIEREIRSLHNYKVFSLTSMLAVPIFERKLYDTPEEQLTVEYMLALADQVELDVQGVMSSRPLLSVPHPLTDESAAYYHGYVLAEMSVHQTRHHFLTKYGQIVDNPQIGADLKNIYWHPGNSRMFLDLVEQMTGKGLSGDAWIESLEEDVDELVVAEKKAYEEAISVGPKFGPKDAVDLDMRVVLVHGDEVIADSKALKGGLSEACVILLILTNRLVEQFDRALSRGHLVFTPSTCVIVRNGDIDFQIRYAPSLAKKPTGGLSIKASTTPKSIPKKIPFNPFLIPDKELLVDSDLLPNHNILLNKFSIVKGHVIIATKTWESQSSLLNEFDFAAAWKLMNSGDYLGFYNCGPLSGARKAFPKILQFVPHKHMQFIPVHPGEIPISALTAFAVEESDPFIEIQIPKLPYLHRACVFPNATANSDSATQDLSQRVAKIYRQLLKSAFSATPFDFENSINNNNNAGSSEIPVDLENRNNDGNDNAGGESRHEVSYNVIFTSRWMVVVPRRAESYDGVSVNSVGFAGMLLVKNEELLEKLRSTDGVVDSLLREVAFER